MVDIFSYIQIRMAKIMKNKNKRFIKDYLYGIHI